MNAASIESDVRFMLGLAEEALEGTGRTLQACYYTDILDAFGKVKTPEEAERFYNGWTHYVLKNTPDPKERAAAGVVTLTNAILYGSASQEVWRHIIERESQKILEN